MGQIRDWKQRLQVFGPAALLAIAAFVAAYQFIKPAPPEHLVIAAGPASGAYHAHAQAYRDLLAESGIRVDILETAGTVENLAHLRNGAADVGFVQGGVALKADRDAGLTALGSLYYEPLWIFHRKGVVIDRLPQVRSLRSAIGSRGSGTQALVRRLLVENGLSTDCANLYASGGAAAVADLLAGRLDAAFLVASAQAASVRRLFASPAVELASLERVDAYTRRLRYLSALQLPEGTVDLAQNIPPRDTRLLAPAAQLVAGDDLHPALVDLLLQAAERAHSDGGWFEDPGEFPSPQRIDFPLNPDAARYYEHGPPFLQRYLPFWAASLIDRLKIMLVPLVVLLLPLLKVMPPIYTWRMRSRVYRWYRELDAVESCWGRRRAPSSAPGRMTSSTA